MYKPRLASVFFNGRPNAWCTQYARPTYLCSLILLMFAQLASSNANAELPTFTIEIREHLFYPAEFQIPADTKVKLMVINQDSTPEEFESYELNREKVIMGGAKAIIFIGPLKAGRYPFFGEFNPKTAQGTITVGQ